MNLLNDIEIFDLGLYYEETLIISDLHIGFDEEMKSKGVLIPYSHFDDVFSKIKEMLNELKPERVVINGDLKHEYGRVSKSEKENITKLAKYIMARCELIIIKGNHDVMLGFILEGLGVEIHDSFVVGELFICHGDRVIENDKSIIVIGHEHPTLELTESGRKERYKCFLKGKYKDKTLIVLPAFSPTSMGMNVLLNDRMSPYLERIDGFEVIVAEANGMKFGTVGELKVMMK